MIRHNAPWSFADFTLYVYCITDDLLKQYFEHHPRPKRRGPAPKCSDSEVIAMALIGECVGWDRETELLLWMTNFRDLFPNQLSQSRFNRRRRQLAGLTNEIRLLLLWHMNLALDGQCVIDSVPVPVLQFYLTANSLASGAGKHWLRHKAAFGKATSRKQTFLGYKLQVLITISGLILDFLLAPANVKDLDAGKELLSGHCNLTVVGDKAYLSAPVAEELLRSNHIRLLTERRSNQREQLAPWKPPLLKHFRQMIETVNAQLNRQFHIETNHAHTFQGLCARLNAKLTAHTLCIYINQLLGEHNWLRIKHLPFRQLA
jgi:hypothetical protein